MHTFQRWREIILAARDMETLHKAMAEYVQTIPPSVIQMLPSDCHHALVQGDIQTAAVCLLQYELSFDGDATVARLLHEAAHTFASAATRMTRFNHPFAASAE
jgi:hypothetical protein